MNYQKRRRTARVIVKLCEALPSIIGVRKLEFAHLQKKHNVNLLLLEKMSNMYKLTEEMYMIQKTIRPHHFEFYKFCISVAQHNMHEFKTLSDSLSFDYEKELEKISSYLSAFPEEKNYTEELDIQITEIVRKFNAVKTQVNNLEIGILTMDTELDVFKQEYEMYLAMTAS